MGSDADKQARIPADQVDSLILAVERALHLVHQGRTADGYTLLLEGGARAQEAIAGQEWEAARLERSPVARALGSGGRWGGREGKSPAPPLIGSEPIPVQPMHCLRR